MEEKFFIELQAKVDKCLRDLNAVSKKFDETKDHGKQLADDTKKAGESMSSAFQGVAASLTALLSAGAIIAFIKRLSEANLKMQQLSSRSGTASKSVRALQNQFKALGYSATEADSSIE